MENRKRKADSLSRISHNSSSVSGRGSATGWTLCPLCGRHSNKRFALGRGIATHLHAVHTPWNPGKVERNKRRRISERRERLQSMKINDDNSKDIADALTDVETRETWQPTLEEVEVWEAKVMKIVLELDQMAKNEDNGDILKAGKDRNGNVSQDYKESLPPFLRAAADGNLVRLREMVEEAQKSGNLAKLLNQKDRHLSTAIQWAAGSGQLGCLKYLAKIQSDFLSIKNSNRQEDISKLRRRDGKTCLHYAARNGHLECVKYLVEVQKRDINERSGDGTTPFHMACYGGHIDVVQYLIEHGADVVAMNEWGCGAAHWVGMTKNKANDQVRELCRLLRCQGVSFAQRQKQGHSALHKAAQKKNQHVIEWLAQKREDGGAGLSDDDKIQAGMPDDGGHTPSEIWIKVGGSSDFATRMKNEWKW